MSLRLIDELFARSRRDGEAVAVRAAGAAEDQAVTYAALAAQVSALAQRLRQTVGEGGTVLLCCANSPQYLAAFLGVLAAGQTVFPVPFDAAAEELAGAAGRSGAGAALAGTQAAQKLAGLFAHVLPIAELGDGIVLLSDSGKDRKCTSPALLLQSSGTTARPKVVRRDANSLDAVAANMVRACGFREDDHVLAAVPLCHSYGLEHGLLAPIAAGSRVHVCDGFDLPTVLRELRTGGITIFPGVPFMFEALCRSAGEHFPKLRSAYSAGGPLPRATFDEFARKFGVHLGQVYGATEVGSVTFSDPQRHGFDPTIAGQPMQGVSLRILDAHEPRVDCPLAAGVEGQVAIRAPSMLSGYVDDPDPLRNGYFLTGDLGFLDSQGALTITGRLKLLIDIAGRKVNPAEVEQVMGRHPQVGQCVVVPMRLSPTVCRLKAIVTPARADVEISPQELREFARRRLSPHKVPRVFEVRDQLPTSPAGKVLRHQVDIS